MKARPLTSGERDLAASIFGSAIDYGAVQIFRKKWFFFQPRHIIMAPTGHIFVHPKGRLWSEDYSGEPLHLQALFLHEMTHVWQSQKGGRFYLPLMRHPFCRYSYALKPGLPFEGYGLEQQAEIVRHAFLIRNGVVIPGAPAIEQYQTLLPFK